MSEFIPTEFIQIWAYYCAAKIARRLRRLRGGWSRLLQDCSPLAESKPAELIHLLQFRERHAAAVTRNLAQLEITQGEPGKN